MVEEHISLNEQSKNIKICRTNYMIKGNVTKDITFNGDFDIKKKKKKRPNNTRMKFAIPHGNSGKKIRRRRREMHQFLTRLSRANGNFYSIDLVNMDPITPSSSCFCWPLKW